MQELLNIQALPAFAVLVAAVGDWITCSSARQPRVGRRVCCRAAGGLDELCAARGGRAVRGRAVHAALVPAGETPGQTPGETPVLWKADQTRRGGGQEASLRTRPAASRPGAGRAGLGG